MSVFRAGQQLDGLVEPVTERLRLRQWRPSDREPFAALNADPVVMEHFPAPLTREQSDQMAEVIESRLAHHGWGLWAVEVREGADFIGFVGLSEPSFTAHFTPAVEVGWRLATSAWGHGYATEAARAALAVGFDALGLDEIVSFTTAGNLRSQRVMQRLGMTRKPADDFDHPRLDPDSPLLRHVLYRLPRPKTQPTLR